MTCCQCDEQLVGEPSIIRHFQSNHPDDKPFECTKCSHRYWTDRARTKHERLCTGTPRTVATHVCRLCEQTFTSHRLLLQHFKDEHKDAKPYVCAKCGQAFSRRDTQQQHEHKCDGQASANTGAFTQFSCAKKSGATSTQRQQAKEHTDSRNGAALPHKSVRGRRQQLKCIDCGRNNFRSVDGYILHCSEKHQRLKPFRCNNCNTFFVQYTSLVKHEQQACDGRSMPTEERDGVRMYVKCDEPEIIEL
jgi:KRAB domain-containing zinc finger protein